MQDGFFAPKQHGFPQRPKSPRRLLWVGLFALLLTGMAGRSPRTASVASVLLRPVQQLVQNIVGAFTPPANSPGNDVDPERELVVRTLAVVNDSRASSLGPWSFGYLMKNLAPPGQDPADFAEAWMRLWIATAAANPDDYWTDPSNERRYPDSEAAGVRVSGLDLFLSNWPRQANGKLDLANAPFRLLAIVNRLDIGEARLSFSGFVASNAAYPDRELGEVLDLAVIFEYELPPLGADGTVQDAAWWANQWHQLARYPLLSEDYRNALQTLTDRFTLRGVSPQRINGSALKALRTNEQAADLGPGFDTSPVWQLQGFQLAADGKLSVAQLTDTPHINYNRFACGDNDDGFCQQELIDYLLENRASILDGTWLLDPDRIQPAIYGPMFPTSFSWLSDVETPAGVSDDDWEQLRLTFSGRTCNGCHGHGRGYTDNWPFPPHEFLHVGERDADEASMLSRFLKQQIQTVRIPHMLSYIAPEDARARRADPRRSAVH